jgi:hypothetical protein
MPPQDPYRPGQPPQPAPGGVSHHTPHFGQAGYFQQHQNGQYEVVPPLPTGGNDGHTGHNPYDFIMNPNTNTKRSGGFLSGDAFLMRIGLLVGGLVVLFVVAAVLISSLSPKGVTPGLASIAERQQEIIRVATAATQQTTSQDAKNFVSNVELSMTSSQQGVLSYLTARGTKLSSKVLALDQSSATDSQLATAATANNYDSAVTQNLTEQLQVYESLLQTTYKQSTGPNSKALLQTDYNGAVLLLQQAKTLSTELQ